MGRTNPTYRDALRALEAEWAPMGRALRGESRDDFDRLFERGRNFADAAGHANPPDPERAFLLSVLLAHEETLREVRETEVEAVRERLRALEERRAREGAERVTDAGDAEP